MTHEPTSDTTKHLNGGCRSENSAGTEWRCYVGSVAERRETIGPDLLDGNDPPGLTADTLELIAGLLAEEGIASLRNRSSSPASTIERDQPAPGGQP